MTFPGFTSAWRDPSCCTQLYFFLTFLSMSPHEELLGQLMGEKSHSNSCSLKQGKQMLQVKYHQSYHGGYLLVGMTQFHVDKPST